MIPIHPTPGRDTRTVRWKMPAGTLPAVGSLTSVPAPLEEMHADGTVTCVVAGEDHLDVTLGEGRSWQVEGARVRTAILASLEQPRLWAVAASDPASPPAVVEDPQALDARLREVASAVLAGEVGELAHSHGGAIELDNVHDGVVTVRMEGACNGCPAAGLTLHARLERRLREACPELREVRTAGPPAPRRPVLTLFRRS